MSLRLSKYRTPENIKFTDQLLPEKEKPKLLANSTITEKLKTILSITRFRLDEAPSLLNRVKELKQSINSLQRNLLLRALDLPQDTPRSTHVDDISHKTLNPDFLLLSHTQKQIEDALGYLFDPLVTITEQGNSLANQEDLFSLPEKTSEFFMKTLYGVTPKKSGKLPDQGSFSEVQYLHFDNNVFVIKEQKTGKTSPSQIQHEACCYMRCSPSSSKTPIQAFTKDSLYLKVAQKDFFSHLSSTDCSSTDLLNYFIQIAEAINEFHENSLVHGDIKPENILVIQEDKKNTLKLCDFQFTAKHGTISENLEGTLGYLPPSKIILHTTNRRSQLLTSDDCWAFGILMYVCIAKTNSPFEDPDTITRYLKNELELNDILFCYEDVADTFKELDPDNLFIDIIRSCLNPSDEHRITMREILNLLQNPEGV